ncbi:MAG: helix-turn-helix transcriptional regulator [Clostridia bacterium]|nr:helix-turn-helix transcriptional regulator [Clostridia bacterium]
MNLDPDILEESSVHYYIPQPEDSKEYLYYPTSTGYFDCKPTYRVDRHNYFSYLVIVVLSGSLSYTTMFSRGIVRPGYALLIDCHHPHSYKANGKCSFLFMHYNGAQSKAIYEAITSSLGNVLHLQNPGVISEYLSEIMTCMSTGKRINYTQASMLVYNVLMQLLAADTAQSEGSTGNPTIDQAIAYIRDHLSEKITVKSIAESIGYSESYFAHKFMEAMGVTPYQFVMSSRIERAKQLLRTTPLTIQEIAIRTGFNSVANFSYAFRKEIGCTPHGYRELPM